MSILDGLTAPQRSAVEHVDGPLLVVAGPGSGKTRVVTRRIAHMVERGISPRSILAITFTNKAAAEMKERVETLLPESNVWVSTFHKFCVRTLRQYGPTVGLSSNFTILDDQDQKRAMRSVVEELGIDPVTYPPDKLGYRISNLKNDLITADEYREKYLNSIGDHWQAILSKVYPGYQKYLLEANSVDFDDLLLHVAKMLTDHEEIRSQLDARYRYILVDEYQDTNAAQYRIVQALSQRYPNLCATGDPDQSIYGWRGARIANILRFERDFPQSKVVRLEHNFRSSAAILRSADSLIAHNSQRKAKSLIPTRDEGTPVQLVLYSDGNGEADGIAKRIHDAVESGARKYQDFAVFYRVNALSRTLELSLLRNRIPFQVAQGVAFYDRAEIKDMIGYLRLVYNAADRTAFLRVVNTPLRGLGETSQKRLMAWAEREGLTPLEACRRAKEIPRLSAKAIAGFQSFGRMMEALSLADSGSVAALIEAIIEKTRFTSVWQASRSEQDLNRLANVQELVTAARQYDELMGEDRSLEGFLEETALVSDTDFLDDAQGRVTLMTLHASKGLEFPEVFILGLEEGLIPHDRAIRDPQTQERQTSGHEFEEERRLLFVGMTRAREKLTLTHTGFRAFRGKVLTSIPSPFISEFEADRINEVTSPFANLQRQVEHRDELESHLEEHRARTPVGKPLEFDKKPLLTTAADLLNGTNKPAEVPRGFALGQQVRHPRFGVGTVTQSSGLGRHKIVKVTFADTQREETFVVGKAPLQPIGT
ncbi:ATP-dependent helicase [Planctomyces sp. SH-PL14]|uniref:ATP-dependent helicase n=1 Tax=Planctomyces sp. SH-PL14 TaxID=1632864 RepID=UPI00078BC00E|nr:UvrD-helicase domain-containing protein [Planctomyces sp. SH-PL14]AMV16348.1 ATP-dependent DNA helicase PcrA [Planctomyces sp. SH-PL14]